MILSQKLLILSDSYYKWIASMLAGALISKNRSSPSGTRIVNLTIPMIFTMSRPSWEFKKKVFSSPWFPLKTLKKCRKSQNLQMTIAKNIFLSLMKRMVLKMRKWQKRQKLREEREFLSLALTTTSKSTSTLQWNNYSSFLLSSRNLLCIIRLPPSYGTCLKILKKALKRSSISFSTNLMSIWSKMRN